MKMNLWIPFWAYVVVKKQHREPWASMSLIGAKIICLPITFPRNLPPSPLQYPIAPKIREESYFYGVYKEYDYISMASQGKICFQTKY